MYYYDNKSAAFTQQSFQFYLDTESTSRKLNFTETKKHNKNKKESGIKLQLYLSKAFAKRQDAILKLRLIPISVMAEIKWS